MNAGYNCKTPSTDIMKLLVYISWIAVNWKKIFPVENNKNVLEF